MITIPKQSCKKKYETLISKCFVGLSLGGDGEIRQYAGGIFVDGRNAGIPKGPSTTVRMNIAKSNVSRVKTRRSPSLPNKKATESR